MLILPFGYSGGSHDTSKLPVSVDFTTMGRGALPGAKCNKQLIYSDNKS
jgi:hypothetical protein